MPVPKPALAGPELLSCCPVLSCPPSDWAEKAAADAYDGCIVFSVFLLGCVLLLLLPLALPASGTNYEVLEVGLLAPNPTPTGQLLTGQVGYMLVSGQEGLNMF